MRDIKEIRGRKMGTFEHLRVMLMKKISANAPFLVALLVTAVGIGSCMRYLTHNRDEVIIKGVDIDQTLDVAAVDLKRGGWGSVLTVWAIRDQEVTPPQTARISQLYFQNIDKVKWKFNIWHFTWAIADLYRNGSQPVRDSLQAAYNDARVRVKQSYGTANKFVNGDKLYMGDAHSLGRAYAHRHVVVPGNADYVQSFAEYLKTINP
jgi:hypothetical protein